MSPTARDYFERPGLLTVKQAQFLVHVGLAGEPGFASSRDDQPMVVDLVRLGFLFFSADGLGGPYRVHLTSAGEFISELAAARIASMMRKRPALRVVHGGKG